jgi:MbtH protein
VVIGTANSGLLGRELYTAQSGTAKPQAKAKSTGETVMADEQEDKTIYKVVLNHEEQYSIWPAHRENALGWKDAGKSGTKEECLAYIKEVWTDMRPLSLRKKMQEQGLA